MKNKNHVITRNDIEQKCQKSIQSDVVIPNNLCNGETCQGLRHWRPLSNLKNNFSKPVRNDMDNKNRLDCFAFARNDEIVGFKDNKMLKQSWIIGGAAGSTQPSPGRASLLPKSAVQNDERNKILKQVQDDNTAVVQNDAKDKKCKGLINLSTYRLIDFKKKFAFTLAEVLITLGIIGIVAALTIPGLMTNYKKHKIESKLSKAVSTINQVIKQSEAENGEMETWDKTLTPVEYIDKYIRPYVKINQICQGTGSCGFKNSNKIYQMLDHNYGGYNSPFNEGRVPFILMDGVMYAWGITPDTVQLDNNKIIIIDINGSEGPNTMGQDVFFLKRIEEEDSIIPYGADLPQEAIMDDCKKNGYGLYCAALIRQNGWKIPKGYPLN